jgi:hypothetical protein
MFEIRYFSIDCKTVSAFEKFETMPVMPEGEKLWGGQ